ncbi:AsmA-like C-terminal region-containing protein [Caballeronia sp. LZ062]|uniref:YhdP family phospholipid transporter n=1 Tax=unclassified Caballeronia TaxID=2646786 RepID=UPI002863593E|nr:MULTISPECIES: AsmA-like C-terminal region-containing protein [unclassified Caballeronia]MDR5853637.1 AsmA-like C-terminal region-containing protein [Caballeronia sp. LZ050]MDR5871830.1 AsmA-like C-terminal region-containing protein [Caballeronia sp. LZ062]
MSDSRRSVDPTEVGQAKPSADAERVLSRVLKVVLVVAAVLYFAVACIYLGLRYVVLPQIDSFRPRIEEAVSSRMHAQLRIGRLSARWSGMQPTIDIDNLRIDAADGSPGLAVPHASASVAWRSLVQLKPKLADLTVDGPDVIVARNAKGEITVAGVPIPTHRTGSNAFTTWLLGQEHILLRDGTLRWRDAERAAPEIAFKRLRLTIMNDGLRHRMALAAPPDGDVLHGPLDLRADFRHEPFSAMGAPANWTGRLYVSTGPLDLPTLARYVKMPFAIYDGRVENRIWLNFARGQLQTANGDLAGGNIALRVRATQPRLDLPVARFGWTVDKKDGAYTLNLSNLRAELGQPAFDDGTPVARLLTSQTLSATYRPAAVNVGQLFRVTGDQVDLGILAEFTRALPVPARVLNELVRFNPRGQIANYTIYTERVPPRSEDEVKRQREKGDAKLLHYAFKGELQGISVQAQEPPPGLTANNHPRAGIPGIENLWGAVDANESQGSISIDTKNAAVTIPGAFDDPRLLFDSLQGHATWTVADAIAPGELRRAFTIHLDTLRVKNADAEGEITAAYWNQGHGRGNLDLKAKIAHMNATRLVRYLPTSLNERVRVYLGHALQAGTARNATLEVHGDLTRFPYAKFPDAGVFRIEAPFTGGKFDPSPFPPRKMANGMPNFWPAFEGIDGTFTLAQNKLGFDIHRGHYKGVAVSRVTGRIDDTGNREAKLWIDGQAHGPLADMLQYVDNSSLGLMAKHATRKLDAKGSASLALTLGIPRYRPPPPLAPLRTEYKGSLTFADNEVAYGNLPPLTHLRGRAAFAAKTVTLDSLTAQLLGGDVRATGGVRPDGSYTFDVNGRIGTDAAARFNARMTPQVTQLLSRIDGAAPYELHVRGAKKALPTVQGSADLTGVGIDLPAPFGKTKGAPMPFALSFAPASGGASGLHDARLTLGPLQAHYLLQQVGRAEVKVDPENPAQPMNMRATLKAVRGAITVNRPADLPAEGVVADVDLNTLDADAWRKVFADATAAQKTPSAPSAPASDTVRQFVPTRAALHIGTLKLLDRRWENIAIDAHEESDNRKWLANIASDQVTGNVAFTPGAVKGGPGAVQARLDKVAIPEKSDNAPAEKAMSKPPRNMPSIDVIVNQLFLRGHDLGRFEVDAHNEVVADEPIWTLDKLQLANPDATFTANAIWRTLPGAEPPRDDESIPRRTSVDFKLDVNNGGQFLDRFGLPHTVNAGTGSVSGHAGWNGGPTAVDLDTLDGKVAVDLRHGQILRAPAAAKWLGIFSLRSLANLLTLHFADVVGKGLPFEKVTGNARIENGIGRTDDLSMITSPARVQMQGTVDLPKKTQDLHVKVIPTVGAGAVALGAAVINPLLGLGALAADLALSQSIKKAFAVDYSITGSWSKPVVQRLHGDQGKIESPAAVARPSAAQ